MSATMTSGPGRSAGPEQADRQRSEVRARAWLVVAGLSVLAALFVGLVLLAWMVNEVHFDRPSDEFDEFAARVDALPGVTAVEHERWVEAPAFWSPTSSMVVTVDEEGLPGLLDAACAADYADPVSWSFRVITLTAAEVALHGAPPVAGSASRCPDLGIDAVPLVAALDRAAPGLAVQPSIWAEGRLTFVALEDDMSSGYTHLLPLVEHSTELLAAAGLGADDAVEINSANLGALIHPDETDAYLAMLTELSVHGVSSYWGDSGDVSSDEIELVQIVAPESQHEAIEEIIRSSGLRLAGSPVRFIEQ